MKFPLVTAKDHGIRPAGSKDGCFYCKSKVGEEHDRECVVVNKRVKVKATIVFDVEVPYSWDAGNIEFKYNDGNWCADNIIHDLKRYIKSHGCLCSGTEIKYIETVDDTPMVTGDDLRKLAANDN